MKIVSYDEHFFQRIPEKWVSELRRLCKNGQYFRGFNVNKTILWHYFHDRKELEHLNFENFRNCLYDDDDCVAQGFRIPPINSAPKSDRIFAPGFGIIESRIFSHTGPGKIPHGQIDRVGNFCSIWPVFYDSVGNNFLDDPTITLPGTIVYGKIMKSSGRNRMRHFERTGLMQPRDYEIANLMQRIGQKYSIPVFSLDSLEAEVAAR